MHGDAASMAVHCGAWGKSLTPYSVFDAWRFLQTRLQSLHQGDAQSRLSRYARKSLYLQAFLRAAWVSGRRTGGAALGPFLYARAAA
jgi:hypothetical protein